MRFISFMYRISLVTYFYNNEYRNWLVEIWKLELYCSSWMRQSVPGVISGSFRKTAWNSLLSVSHGGSEFRWHPFYYCLCFQLLENLSSLFLFLLVYSSSLVFGSKVAAPLTLQRSIRNGKNSSWGTLIRLLFI